MLLTGEPALVSLAAALLEEVLAPNADALGGLAQTGAFFFALAYCGSNLTEVARLLQARAQAQGFLLWTRRHAMYSGCVIVASAAGAPHCRAWAALAPDQASLGACRLSTVRSPAVPQFGFRGFALRPSAHRMGWSHRTCQCAAQERQPP